MIVAPDLAWAGLSSSLMAGYDKKNSGVGRGGRPGRPGCGTAELVTHDIGVMVGFAVAATHPSA